MCVNGVQRECVYGCAGGLRCPTVNLSMNRVRG